ncbi:sorting nexin-12 [Salpingoeca rosetta]|uniref:Sorting nexin-3 n=1 Tax=Salpingoeca rosetta (strain ATCC 50818 / BSB-021) TaxID=946362 RepID=F2U9G6_SALR5|nr:sorting nexin-12 [Salpingoeca rosetta]EGD72993.1 sorting nexin-12 [Salpingoeca rosetta]|eukprot:XP_004994024.1 sorting nexin-12 [Salpingoeca rosetta]
MSEVITGTPAVDRPQTLAEAYAEPDNFLEIDVCDPKTEMEGTKKFTTYEVRVRTNLPVFKQKESSVRRRYSEFQWLRKELERDSKIVVPPLPGKSYGRQLPWVSADKGLFAEDFIERRRKGLEEFINKVAGHPLARNQKSLHMFLQDPVIDRNYTPGEVRGHH